MESIKHDSNLILLFFFDRGHPIKIKNEHGEIIDTFRKEYVKCKLWFDGPDDLASFFERERPYPWSPKLFNTIEEFHAAEIKKIIITKWVPYYSMTKEQLGFTKD